MIDKGACVSDCGADRIAGADGKCEECDGLCPKCEFDLVYVTEVYGWFSDK